MDTTDTSRVDQAIVQVLHAEQSAREAVAQCAMDAELVRQNARMRARAIAERAAERVARAHQWTDAALRPRSSGSTVSAPPCSNPLRLIPTNRRAWRGARSPERGTDRWQRMISG